MLRFLPIVLAAAAAALAAHYVLKSWMDEVNPAITGGIAGAVAAATTQATRPRREG